jgi:hypothetical protein
LEEINNIIKNKNRNLLITLKDPIMMPKFEESDIFEFYLKNMKLYLKSINFKEFLHDSPDPYYPLNKEILKYLYKCSKGNPRKFIKLLIKIFNYIIYQYEDLDYILNNYKEIC